LRELTGKAVSAAQMEIARLKGGTGQAADGARQLKKTKKSGGVFRERVAAGYASRAG
jgi:X-X-X-Leu-X-X-Gly heptad repeat protein